MKVAAVEGGAKGLSAGVNGRIQVVVSFQEDVLWKKELPEIVDRLLGFKSQSDSGKEESPFVASRFGPGTTDMGQSLQSRSAAAAPSDYNRPLFGGGRNSSNTDSTFNMGREFMSLQAASAAAVPSDYNNTGRHGHISTHTGVASFGLSNVCNVCTSTNFQVKMEFFSSSIVRMCLVLCGFSSIE